jgi:putative transposase
VKAGGEMALAPQPVRDRQTPEWAGLFIKCYGQPQNPSLTEAMEAMAKNLPEGMAMPSYHQVYRFHDKRSRLDRERGRKTGSEFKAIKGFRTRDTSELLPFQVGLCDGHSFKAKVAHPATGNPFKPEICCVECAATRIVAGWSVGLAESALTVAGAVRHAATIDENKLYGGVFAIFYTDNGAGNMAGVNEDELTGIFARIGSTHKTGIPGNPQGRGMIERLNSSLWIRAAKELPTYMGSQMDSQTKRNMYLLVNREIKEDGVSKHLPSWPQFLEHLHQSVEAYNRRPHSALPKINDPETGLRRHMAPLEMLAWHMVNGWDPEECRLPAADLEMLFLPREARVVQRSSVSIFGNTYTNNGVLAHYEGETVQVGYDIHDGNKVQIWNNDGQMICYAFFERNKSSFFPIPQVEAASKQRAQRRRQVLEARLTEIDAEERGMIEMAPVCKMLDFKASSPRIKADREQLQAEMTAAPVVEIPVDDKGKYEFWKALDLRVGQGEVLEGKELRFYGSFCNGITYKAFKATEEQFSGQVR